MQLFSSSRHYLNRPILRISTLVLSLIVSLTNLSPPVVQAVSGISLSPMEGPMKGGNEVIITGDGFMGDDIVSAGKIIDIAVGLHHYVALTKSGHIYTWGNYNGQGQMGSGDNATYDISNPRDITSTLLNPMTNQIEHASSVYASVNSSYALTDEGHIFWWGNGQLQPTMLDGLGDNTIKSFAVDRKEDNIIADPDGRSGTDAIMATDNGDIYEWRVGGSLPILLNNVDDDDFNHKVTKVDISPVGDNRLALTSDNYVYSWHGDGNATQAQKVFGISVDKIVDLTAGMDADNNDNGEASQRSLALTDKNTIWAWRYGKMPESLPAISGKVRSVKTTNGHAYFALVDNNVIYQWSDPIKDKIKGDYRTFTGFSPNGRVEFIDLDVFSAADDSVMRSDSAIALTDQGELYSLGQFATGQFELIDQPVLTYAASVAKPLITKVLFGDQEASFTVTDNNIIEAKAPASLQAGLVDIVLVDVDGNRATVPQSYNYQPNANDEDGADDTGNDNETPVNDQDDKSHDLTSNKSYTKIKQPKVSSLNKSNNNKTGSQVIPIAPNTGVQPN